MKEQIIPVDLYKRGVVILQGAEEELKKWFCEHDAKHLCSAMTDTDWYNTKAITFDDDSDIYVCSIKPMELTTLCHELSHATLRILKIVGIDPVEAEEAYAYLFEYLIGQVTVSDDAPSLLSKDVSWHIPR